MKHASRVVGALVVFVPYAVMTAVWTYVFLSVRDRLPDQVATHYGAGMEADGFSSHAGLFWPALGVLLGMGLMFALLVLFSALPGTARRVLFGCAYGTLGLLAYLFIGTTMLQVDLETAQGVKTPGSQVLAAVFVMCVSAVIGWHLAKVGPQEPEPEPEPVAYPPRLSAFTKPQAATWSRAVPPTPAMVFATVSVLATTLLLAVLQAWVGVVLSLPLALVVAAFTSLRVTVDPRGVAIGSGWVPGLRRVIAMDGVLEAHSRQVSPMAEFGGWGYRVVPGKRGVVVRAGEALVLRLREGREFVVTIDDSRTAAALVNTLLEER